MNDPDDLHDLLSRANRGEHGVFDDLFCRYSAELRQAIQLRLDRRLRARLDVSDVLQETYLEALRRLPGYLVRPAAPFGLWLRWLARDRVLVLHRHHLDTDRRSVRRELAPLPTDTSAAVLHGLGAGPSPSQAAVAGEQAEHLRRALERLDDEEREVILMRHFEHLGNRDIAWLLGLTESAAHKRYIRALQRLRGLLLDQGITGT